MEIGRIKRVVSGVASDEEKREVVAWAAEAEERRRFLENARRFYGSEWPEDREIDRRVETMWRTHFAKTHRKRVPYLRWIAALMGTAAVVGTFFFTDVTMKKPAVEKAGEQRPLAASVQLVLPDGSRHELSGEATVQQIVASAEKRDTLAPREQQPLIEYNEIIVPKGKEYTLALADGSVVTLNAESRMRFPAAFVEAERKVFLAGEAYFDVARDTVHPFVVEFPAGTVRVLGTEFNVNAYEEGTASAVLISGKVEIVAGGKTAVLRPGQLCEVQPDGLAVSEADLMVELAWKNGEFIFKDASWKQVMDELARWYDADIRYNESEMNELKLHIYMTRTATLPAALEVISGIVDISYSVEGRTVLIKRR